VMGNVRAVGSDQNIEARQALSALRELSSPNSQRKLEALFGEQWPALKAQIDMAGSALGLRARTASNSATHVRGEFNRALDDRYGPGAIRKGEPITTGKRVWQRAMGATPNQVNALKAADRADLADILTRPGEAQNLLAMIDAARRPPMLDAGH